MTAAPCNPTELWTTQLGTVPYREAVALQETLCALRQQDAVPDVLLLLEHPPTYTRGRRSQPGELPQGEEFYRARGVEVIDTNRGGRLTYHGPGQLVGYPILRERDVLAHVRRMETAIVAALADEGIAARSRCEEGPDFTGVWVDDRKIASIGVHQSRGVTTHGFAVNVNNDLEPFSWIIPCGLAGVQMTSVARELAGAPAAPSLDREADGEVYDAFRRYLIDRYCALLGRTARELAPEALIEVAHSQALPGGAVAA